MADKPRHLLSGYAAGILDDDERHELMEAALTNQDVFDRLVEEESWRRVLGISSLRRELLEALDEPTPVQRLLGVFRPSAARWAVGAVAAGLLALVLVPAWQGPDRQGPDSAVPTGVDMSAKSMTPVDTVAKVPPIAGLRSLSYGLEMLDETGVRPVEENHRFAAEDEFRIRLEADFPAWVYLFNRAEGDDEYTVIYPQAPSEHAAGQGEILLPPDESEALAMGPAPEDEQLVLVVATAPWPLVRPDRATIPYQELEDALGRIESDLRTVSWSRFVEEGRVHLQAADARQDLFFVARLLAE